MKLADDVVNYESVKIVESEGKKNTNLPRYKFLARSTIPIIIDKGEE